MVRQERPIGLSVEEKKECAVSADGGILLAMAFHNHVISSNGGRTWLSGVFHRACQAGKAVQAPVAQPFGGFNQWATKPPGPRPRWSGWAFGWLRVAEEETRVYRPAPSAYNKPSILEIGGMIKRTMTYA